MFFTLHLTLFLNARNVGGTFTATISGKVNMYVKCNTCMPLGFLPPTPLPPTPCPNTNYQERKKIRIRGDTPLHSLGELLNIYLANCSDNNSVLIVSKHDYVFI